MNGVTVLNSFNIYQTSWWQILLALTPLIFSVMAYFLCLLYKKGKPNKIFPKYFILLVISGILSIILGFSFSELCPAAYIETQYEISVDDSASFNEIHNTYEIIDEKENTFIVRERGTK